jgi:hypothetical protein
MGAVSLVSQQLDVIPSLSRNQQIAVGLGLDYTCLAMNSGDIVRKIAATDNHYISGRSVISNCH